MNFAYLIFWIRFASSESAKFLIFPVNYYFIGFIQIILSLSYVKQFQVIWLV